MNATVCGQLGILVFPRGSVGWRQELWVGGLALASYCWLGVGWQRDGGSG